MGLFRTKSPLATVRMPHQGQHSTGDSLMTTRLPTAAPQPEQIQRRAIILLSSIVVLLLLAIVFVSLRAGAGHHPQAPATAAQGATAPDTVVPAPPLASDAEPQLPLVSLDTTEHIAQKVELPPVPELEIAPAAYLAEPPAAVEPAVLALAAPPAMQIKACCPTMRR